MIDRLMQGQDQRRRVGDDKRVRRDLGALFAKQRDFGDKMLRVDDDTIADHRQLARPHDAGRQQRQLVFHAADDKRVAGIVPALEPDDDIGAARQPVDDLALALIAPLGADHGHVCHAFTCLRGWSRERARTTGAALRNGVSDSQKTPPRQGEPGGATGQGEPGRSEAGRVKRG